MNYTSETPEIGYLKEIENVDWTSEVISERFDNAMDMMVKDSVIYGGAIRDALAGKELVGDLDIAVTANAFYEMADAFGKNPRWASHDLSSIAPRMRPKNSSGIAKVSAPMLEVSSFINMNGMVVQLITSRSGNKDRLQASIYPARQVDIICCGIVMLYDGRVFEVLPGAYDDCKSGILRLNEGSDTMFLGTLKHRVEKFVGRGWTNKINVDQAIHDITVKRNRKKKIQKNKSINTLGNIENVKQYQFINNTSESPIRAGAHMQEIFETEQYGSTDRLIALIKNAAELKHINVRVVFSPLGNMYIECANGNKTDVICRELVKHKTIKGKKKVSLQKTRESIQQPGIYADVIKKPHDDGIEVEFQSESGEIITEMMLSKHQAKKLRSMQSDGDFYRMLSEIKNKVQTSRIGV